MISFSCPERVVNVFLEHCTFSSVVSICSSLSNSPLFTLHKEHKFFVTNLIEDLLLIDESLGHIIISSVPHLQLIVNNSQKIHCLCYHSLSWSHQNAHFYPSLLFHSVIVKMLETFQHYRNVFDLINNLTEELQRNTLKWQTYYITHVLLWKTQIFLPQVVLLLAIHISEHHHIRTHISLRTFWGHLLLGIWVLRWYSDSEISASSRAFLFFVTRSDRLISFEQGHLENVTKDLMCTNFPLLCILCAIIDSHNISTSLQSYSNRGQKQRRGCLVSQWILSIYQFFKYCVFYHSKEPSSHFETL